MTNDTRNLFISHIHEDDEGIGKVKEIAERHGMTVRNGSVTSARPNAATSEDYIKYQILAPRINWASALVVYITPDTKNSPWVDWEIEYAHKQGKRVVGVWAWGAKDCELPDALRRYGDSVVGWNGESIIDAINGDSNEWRKVDGVLWDYHNIKRYSCR